ncbi:ABC transporter transmembrane domain-containing protein, partial [Desulfobacter sp.]|uniref:ABC transporter transmembrane domain-containing protein n=1 Tax=Desulfobacter sp. TaxID=2294 RepID=UPI003D09A0AE
MTWAAVLSCFTNILSLTFSFYMFSIYQNIVISYSGWSLANITIAAVIAITSMGLFLFARSRLLSRAGNALNISMREQAFEIMIKSMVIDPQRAYRNGLNDLNTLQNYLSTPAVYAVFDAPWAPFYLVLIFIFQPVLGLIATGGALLSAALTLLQEVLVKDSMKEANRLNSDNQRFVVSFMRNAEVTVGMGMIGNITARFTGKNRAVMENQTRSSNVAGIIHAVTEPLRSTIQVLIYCFGAYFCIKSGFNAGLMVVCS